MKAQEIMTTKVVSVRKTTTVDEIAQVMTTHHIRSVPVVDDQNRVIGVVSEDDLFLKEKGIPMSAVKAPHMFKKWADPARLVEIYEGARHHTAGDVMSRSVVTVDATEHIGRVASLLMKHDLHSVPVVQNGKLIGLVSRTDLIRLLIKTES